MDKILQKFHSAKSKSTLEKDTFQHLYSID